MRPEETEVGHDTFTVGGRFVNGGLPRTDNAARHSYHCITRLKSFVLFVVLVSLLLGSVLVNYLIFRVNHPGAPWWGFFLN